MFTFLERLFSTNGFMPHGMCYEWNPAMIRIQVASDALITLAYFSIPLTLFYFVRRRRDLQFRWIFLCFAVFIVACGTTHLLEIVNIWQPAYWLTATVKVITAAASIVTAFLLVRLVPVALALPSPSAMEKANTGLRENEERFRLIVENVQDYAIFILDPAGKVASWNRGAERIKGYAAGEIIGRHFSTFYPPEDIRADKPGRELATANAAGRSEDEGWRLRKDGTPFWANVIITALHDERGQLRGFAKISRDMTARRRLETDLQEKNLELRDALEAKGRFLANMSHELRTPLNGIIGFAEFLHDEKPGPLNARQKEYLGDILSSGQHLLQLINDILDLAKVEAGRMTLRPSTFLLSKAIDETCAAIRPLFQKKGVELHHRAGSELGEALLDEQKFRQVLFNLLSNAVKFTDAGGRVEIETTDLPEHRFRIDVRDTGIGISPQDLSRLFLEFEQLDPGTARSHDGTGLGLALTRRMVELQGGAISVASEPGRGSTFTVILPRNGARP
jgi:PAS domain S-box-containing protein